MSSTPKVSLPLNRFIHALGAGAHGYFEVTHDITHLCSAKFLERVGKRTPVFVRFSTVGGEKGSADTARDPRGFAVKFYTEQGNWDMVGNNTPVFFIRDPIKFPDFIHTQKRHPQTNLPDPDMLWDFWSLVPESLHQVTILFSDRGTPDGYCHMNGYSSHTLKLVNHHTGKFKYVKWHFKTDQGIKNLDSPQARELAGRDPDYATRDLFSRIQRGQFPSWSVYIQIMEPEDALHYRFNPFDVTKIWPHQDYPLVPVGKMVLNRNPENYFAEVEQAAFSPSHMVPGIEPSEDRMLQGRLFSYPDTHRHRLGPNYMQIPINCPYAARVANHQRDGFMAVNGNGGSAPNYEPNSVTSAGARQTDTRYHTADRVHGYMGRHTYDVTDDDFVQAGNLYRLMPSDAKQRLIDNIVGSLGQAKREIQEKQVQHFKRADPEYGRRVEAGLQAMRSKQ